MRVAVLRETLPGEARVALVPESIKKLTAAKNEVWVESAAGEAAGVNDSDYEAAGAKVTSDRTQLLPAAAKALNDRFAINNADSPAARCMPDAILRLTPIFKAT